ncbi:MAG: NRAMP family divalent metal transporter [Cetobacterium sp.]|uniref:NRAMP family divalent metal transporter n=3 Tax=Fusobacteriaceae TaxID=203492 RepID=UPI001F067895|nr:MULTISPECIES: NRAMP family divalent metal transporter [Cetobacterium]MCX3067633.1 divalent metal cation transporter [Cetobacterium somerae]UPO97541.1 divalent metal cation transporter [Cetobacterium somerae]
MKNNMSSKSGGAVLGAAFLMAMSAVGPGFLTQASIFTEQFKANFAFSILVSIIITLIVQLNISRIIGVSGLRGQDLANKIVPGLGYLIAILIVLGGFAFNIGNVGGAALGLNVLFGIDLTYSALLAGGVGALIFISKDAGKIIDKFTKILGVLMILVISYVALESKPPISEAAYSAVFPESYGDLSFSLLTLLGGTIGGYIIFAGGHKLLDANIKGKENLNNIDKSLLIGVSIASIIRIVLFLAVLGVVSAGATLNPENPPASAFMQGAGVVGYKIFGVVILASSLGTIVGAAYTSISFLKTLFPVVFQHEKGFIIGFILLSTLVMASIGKPVSLLLLAGALNGLILPITLGITLLASRKKEIVGDYKHSVILTIFGIAIVVIMGYEGIISLGSIAAIL